MPFGYAGSAYLVKPLGFKPKGYFFADNSVGPIFKLTGFGIDHLGERPGEWGHQEQER